MTTIDPALIAPCGMNCAICAGYLALKNDVKNKGLRMISCLGCRPRNKKCGFLKKQCTKLSKGKLSFCFECKNFPCSRLRAIDERYRIRYRMSMIENLEFIKRYGLEKFIDDQQKRWRCLKCGEYLSCHNGLCFKCDLQELKNRKQKYRWNEDKDRRPRLSSK